MSITKLLPLLVLATSAAAGPDRPASPLASAIAATTSHPLPNCGVAFTPREIQAAVECSKTALRQNQPFVVQIRIQGIDSIVWQAAVQLPSGQRLLLQHDDFGQGRVTREQCKDLLFLDALLPIGCER